MKTCLAQTEASDFRLLRALTRTMGKSRWRLAADDNIRTQDERPFQSCPLTFAARVATGRDLKSSEFWDAGKLLGMKHDLIADIAAAADEQDFVLATDARARLPAQPCFKARAKIRRILLRAAGLPPEKERP